MSTLPANFDDWPQWLREDFEAVAAWGEKHGIRGAREKLLQECMSRPELEPCSVCGAAMPMALRNGVCDWPLCLSVTGCRKRSRPK